MFLVLTAIGKHTFRVRLILVRDLPVERENVVVREGIVVINIGPPFGYRTRTGYLELGDCFSRSVLAVW